MYLVMRQASEEKEIEASKLKYILVFILYVILNAIVINFIATPLLTSVYESFGVSNFVVIIAAFIELFFLLFNFYIIFYYFNDIKISKIFPFYIFFLVVAVITNMSSFYSILDSYGVGGAYILAILIQVCGMIYSVINYSKKINRWNW